MTVECTQRLRFLLSLGAVPAACSSGGDATAALTGASGMSGDGSSSANGSDEPASASTTGSPTTGASPSTDDMPSDSSTALGSSSDGPAASSTGAAQATGSSSDAGGSTGVGAATTATTGDDVSPACAEYGAHMAECYMAADPSPYEQYCESFADYYASISPECGALNDEYVACLSMADCKALNAGDNPCMAGLDALDVNCLAGGSSTGG